MEVFDKKKEIKLIVTDSGLGGLSIVADLVERLKISKSYKKAQVIFFNSSFDNKSGYNVIESNKEKVRIFNNALSNMVSKYQPDAILIGCNTLSILYPETPFSETATVPVIGIVETGVELIYNKYISMPQSNIIIFAANTTIAKATYQNALIEKGIPEDKITGIQCYNLADKIEEGFNSPETKELIIKSVNSAVTRLNNSNLPVIVSLNCTHYGYVSGLFKTALEKNGLNVITIIDPNPRMSDCIFQDNKNDYFENAKVEVEVVCKVNIFPDVMKSVGELLAKKSIQTVEAMENYKKDVNLF